jgi:hypothetical protein
VKERAPLKCPLCKMPWWVGYHQFGGVAVRPQHWWQPVSEYWEATCGCEDPFTGGSRAIRANTEWELYEAIGVAPAGRPEKSRV